MIQIVDWLERYTGLALDMPDDSAVQDVKEGEQVCHMIERNERS